MTFVRWLAIIGVAALLLYGGLYLPPIGEEAAPANRHVSPYYIERSTEEMATPNIVTAVLADYRSFDTLGETVVILTAALGCFLIMFRNENVKSK